MPVLYGLTLDQIDHEKGGTTFLRARNIVDINELDDYLKELGKRVSLGRAKRQRK